jgi:ketosteroid isomerase-like protein
MRTARSIAALGLSLAMILGCVPSTPLPPIPVRDEPIQEELFAADRAFARAVSDSGAPAWNARLARDVAKPGAGGLILLRGIEPVSAFDKSIFADASKKLVWEPTDAIAYGDRVTGVTVGRSAWVRSTNRADTLARGRYLTLWRKQNNGTWKILLDAGWEEK